ncbi:MAG: glycosyltransferase family 39 protein [Pirellulales bacterium]|nr:glycosyltransferase family 39 protein [Pirellulales bacterium]
MTWPRTFRSPSANRKTLRYPHTWSTFGAVVLLGFEAALLAHSASVHSPTHLELFHLPAGVSHLRLHRFDLYRVSPPLIQMVAALPAEWAGFEADWKSYSTDAHRRAEYMVGLDCMYCNDTQIVWLVTLGRWACIPFVLLGGWVCFVWARRLYNPTSGLVALSLWCFCPYVLGHGSLLTPDAHAAALGIAAAYLFWRWLTNPTWKRALVAGIVLGLAELAKFTLLVFYPLGLGLWLVYRASNRADRSRKRLATDAAMMLAMAVLSVLIINLGYEFEGSFRPLGDYQFQSLALTGAASREEVPASGGNRFSGTPPASLPVPLPANFVQGIDTQKKDFEAGSHSYLRGSWQKHGWWYFHPYALGVKLPLGTWFLILLAGTLALFRVVHRASWRDEMLLVMPAVAVLVLLCSQPGIGMHSRYAFPLLPFVFIWTARVGTALGPKRSALGAAVVLGLAASIGSSLYQYPHSLGYFNELIGSREGYRHLAKSDCSWSQDLLFLKRWMDEHPEAQSWQMALSGPFDPRLVGIALAPPPVAPREQDLLGTVPVAELGPVPGWYAVDVCFLLGGDPLSAADGKGSWKTPSETPGYDLSYFLRFAPVASAGYSIRIYHISLEEANRVRRELGLPEIAANS